MRNTIFRAKAEHDGTRHTIFSKVGYTPGRFGLWETSREERGGRGHTRRRRGWVSSCGWADGRWRRRLEADEQVRTTQTRRRRADCDCGSLQVRRSGEDAGPAPRQGRPTGGRGEAKRSLRSACRLSFPLPLASLVVAVNGTRAVNFPRPRPIYFSHGRFPALSPSLGRFPVGAVNFPRLPLCSVVFP
jgi:hypothetical protein